MLEQGPGERKILEQAFRAGQRVPDRIKNAPTLYMGLDLYINAWFELSTCRDFGFGEGPIPWSEVERYGSLLELSPDTLADLHHHVKAMDLTYLTHREATRNA